MGVPILTIDQGILHGSEAKDWNGSQYLRFQGIPYAKPPVGNLRFKAPQPPEKWEGTRLATKEGSPCYARDMLDRNKIIGSEDCLFLNVYTRELPDENSSLQPVMVWIHGGGFIFGSGNSDLYDPSFLITEDVVVVTINYRLGIFGFLSSENPSLGVPGNAGLKDMVMALKWVQKNIAKFNGDPNNVTIFGESAGGSAVHLLTLSPMARGLFHRAIAQSGTAVNPWVQATHNLPHLGPAVGLDDADESKVLEHLRKLPMEDVLKIQDSLFDVLDTTKPRLFGVVVEKGEAQDLFLSQPPIDIISSGTFNQIPLIAGYTSSEGMCMEVFKGPDMPKSYDVKKKIPSLLGYQFGSKEHLDLAERIQKFYYGDEKPEDASPGKTFTLDTDYLFLYPIYAAVKKHASSASSPVYFYRFSLDLSLNLFKIMAKITEPGASHGDDMCYLFKTSMTPQIEADSVEDKAVRAVQKMVKLWTNFARYGDPTPEVNFFLLGVKWRPIENGKMFFLDIDEDLWMRCDPEPERIAFWRDIYSKSPAGSKYV